MRVARRTGCSAACANVQLIAPQGYRNFVALMARCRLVLTDSGGVQEEAPSLGKPVLVMRDTTERPEGVDGRHRAPDRPVADAIVEHATRLLTDAAGLRRDGHRRRTPTGTGTRPNASWSASAGGS